MVKKKKSIKKKIQNFEGNKIKIGTSVGSVYLDIVSYDSHENKNG